MPYVHFLRVYHEWNKVRWLPSGKLSYTEKSRYLPNWVARGGTSRGQIA